MSALTSGREGEASGDVGGSVLDEADHETQASPSTRSQAQPPIPKDGPSNSGEHITTSHMVLVTLRLNILKSYRRICSI